MGDYQPPKYQHLKRSIDGTPTKSSPKDPSVFDTSNKAKIHLSPTMIP